MSRPTRRTVLKLGIVGIPGAQLLSQVVAAADEASIKSPAANSTLSKASVCFRIGEPVWANAVRFTELLDLFDANRGVTDEITLFTSETHPPLPPDQILRRADVLRERMTMARARGYRSGINPLATIGHHEENLANSLMGEYTPMTD